MANSPVLLAERSALNDAWTTFMRPLTNQINTQANIKPVLSQLIGEHQIFGSISSVSQQYLQKAIIRTIKGSNFCGNDIFSPRKLAKFEKTLREKLKTSPKTFVPDDCSALYRNPSVPRRHRIFPGFSIDNTRNLPLGAQPSTIKKSAIELAETNVFTSVKGDIFRPGQKGDEGGTFRPCGPGPIIPGGIRPRSCPELTIYIDKFDLVYDPAYPWYPLPAIEYTDNHYELKKACKISFGISQYLKDNSILWGQAPYWVKPYNFQAWVPEDYEPTEDKSDMLEVYLKGWHDRKEGAVNSGVTWEKIASKINYDSDDLSLKRKGLY